MRDAPETGFIEPMLRMSIDEIIRDTNMTQLFTIADKNGGRHVDETR